ncbi:MAG: helix-turn-helix domain-containing protein [Propionivibrio sp.]
MLPLDLPVIIITDRDQDDRIFTLHAGCEVRPAGSIACGSENLIGHGQHPHTVMDLPHHGRFLAIKLTRKRYRCKNCGNTFYHPHDWIDDNHQATKRFAERVDALSLERSFSDIAREYGISEHGVRGIFSSRYTECQNGLTPTIDRIGRGYSFDVLRVKPLRCWPRRSGGSSPVTGAFGAGGQSRPWPKWR